MISIQCYYLVSTISIHFFLENTQNFKINLLLRMSVLGWLRKNIEINLRQGKHDPFLFRGIHSTLFVTHLYILWKVRTLFEDLTRCLKLLPYFIMDIRQMIFIKFYEKWQGGDMHSQFLFCWLYKGWSSYTNKIDNAKWRFSVTFIL